MTQHRLERPARSIGAGPLRVLELSRSGNVQHGHVLGTFSHGHYVKFSDVIFAIGETTIHPGPLHLLHSGPTPPLRIGAPVSMSGTRLWSRRVEIDLRRAATWSPPRLETSDVSSSLELLGLACTTKRPPELHVNWRAVELAVLHTDLTALRVLVQGRGPGLTPTGDDVLAGVLLVSALARPDDRDIWSVGDNAMTSDLSRGFLHWAARGQSIEPVHRLILQASQGRERAALQTAAIIRNIGASSGHALLAGIGLAARALQRDSWPRASRPCEANPSRS